jgi:hypothetical protein
MAECKDCGAQIAPGENFCGNCGAQSPPESAELKTISTTLDQIEETGIVETDEPVVESQSAPVSDDSLAPISSSSLGGSSTDPNVYGTSATPKKGTTGGHHPSVKQLDSATVLNGRYEIVRRIGGGGMGAVYLAKDRNLGDAPRAVKEMVESHLDPTQHEKAIGDFKRESLLLTSL